MRIVLSSTNQAKLAATQRACAVVLSEAAVGIETVEVDSGVSATPLTDEEGIRGCMNRIDAARKARPGADLYLGLEGVIVSQAYGMFIYGWCVVEVASSGRVGIGCSAKVQVPEFIAQRVESFSELSELVKTSYPSVLVHQMPMIGSNGVITNGCYSRDREFEDAIRCALGYALNDTNFRT